jgi:hypothetical protein
MVVQRDKEPAATPYHSRYRIGQQAGAAAAAAARAAAAA